MKTQALLKAVALGQLLAFCIALTAIFSSALAHQGISAPFSQSALNYLLLALTYCHLHFRHQHSLAKPWWAYALLALLDVEANFCLVLAYKFTSLTSVTLLDCFTIPVSVVLSAALLGARFRGGHYAGAAICVAGLSVLVLTDKSGGGMRDDVWWGDGLVLVGATLYAACNVVAEKLIGDVSVHELLAMQGLFGLAWTLIQGLPLELQTLASAPWSPSAILPFLGFGLAMFCFYSLVPFELQWGGAALLNLSLLTSDLWTALARFLLFGGFGGNSLLFFALSFVIVAAGIVVYTRSGEVYPGSPSLGEVAAGQGKVDAAGTGVQGRGQPPSIYWAEGEEEGWNEERIPLAGSMGPPRHSMEGAWGHIAPQGPVQQQACEEGSAPAAAHSMVAVAGACCGSDEGGHLLPQHAPVLGRGSWEGGSALPQGQGQGEGQALPQVWGKEPLHAQQQASVQCEGHGHGRLPSGGGSCREAGQHGTPSTPVRRTPPSASPEQHFDIESPNATKGGHSH